MLLITLLTSLAGLILSKNFRFGSFNPFTIYFSIWTIFFATFSLFQSIYTSVSTEYLLAHCCAQLLAIFIMLVSKATDRQPQHSDNTLNNYKLHLPTFNILQLILMLSIPVVYQKATTFAGGESVFSMIGYINLRRSFNEDHMSMGILKYLYPLSFLNCAITLYFASLKELSKKRAVAAVLTALFYAYLATGRTFFLMVFAFSIPPLAMTGKIKGKSLLILGSILLSFFFLVASMTAKGTSMDASILENVFSFIDSFQSYTVAPFVALYMLLEKTTAFTGGDNTFRFLFSILSSLGLADPPVALIKGYEYTPIETNIYTVYEVYARDFSLAGFFIPPLFLFIHWWLYKKANSGNTLFIFFYAASVYPLATQLLQDQYVTLFSTWIQVAFWCAILVRKKRTIKVNYANIQQERLLP